MKDDSSPRAGADLPRAALDHPAVPASGTVPASTLSPLEAMLGEFAFTLQRWADAYPPTMYREPDWKKVNEVLQASGLSLGDVTGSSMRRVATCLNDLFGPVRDELYAKHSAPAKDAAIAAATCKGGA